jgi:hypothetical protein
LSTAAPTFVAGVSRENESEPYEFPSFGAIMDEDSARCLQQPDTWSGPDA